MILEWQGVQFQAQDVPDILSEILNTIGHEIEILAAIRTVKDRK